LLLMVLLTGCTVRSISDSGYRSGPPYGYRSDNPFYKGELSEFDVLGIDPGKEITEEEIAAAAGQKKERITLKKGDAILLIQSGALMPDNEMTEGMEKYFSVASFTGIPEQNKKDNASYAKTLRYAAAKAGIQTILVYWGLLDSGTANLATRTVSWVPIVGWTVPDKAQEIRIRLKVAVIDVPTGRWEIFSPKNFDDKAYSSILSRERSDQEQVSVLKTKAYQAAVEATIARYVR